MLLLLLIGAETPTTSPSTSTDAFKTTDPTSLELELCRGRAGVDMRAGDITADEAEDEAEAEAEEVKGEDNTIGLYKGVAGG